MLNNIQNHFSQEMKYVNFFCFNLGLYTNSYFD